MAAAPERVAFIACSVINGTPAHEIGKRVGISAVMVHQITNAAIRLACPSVYSKNCTISEHDGLPNPPGIRFYRRYRRFFTRELMKWAAKPPV